jgi:hypothetical protein
LGISAQPWISALRMEAGQLALSRFLRDVPVLAASLAGLLRHGPSAPRPVREPDQRVRWTVSGHRQA